MGAAGIPVFAGFQAGVGLSVCYSAGTAWFMISTGAELAPAIVACVLPFVPGDIIKIFIASFIIKEAFQ